MGKVKRRLNPFRRSLDLLNARGRVVGHAQGSASGMTVDAYGVRIARLQLFRRGKEPVWKVACDLPDRIDSRILVMLAALLTPDDTTLHTLFQEPDGTIAS